jgi:organic hydroperoxide reductase OsmC/OhrA
LRLRVEPTRHTKEDHHGRHSPYPRGKVTGLDNAAFKRLADEAEKKCPVSNLLRSGLTITLDASLM